MALVFGAEIPFVDHCAIEEVGLIEGRTQLRMTVGPQHMNNIGIVHGGALSALLDVLQSRAAGPRRPKDSPFGTAPAAWSSGS